jgi:hypothetical protein
MCAISLSYLTEGWGLPSVMQGSTADWSFLAVIVAVLSTARGALGTRDSEKAGRGVKNNSTSGS